MQTRILRRGRVGRVQRRLSAWATCGIMCAPPIGMPGRSSSCSVPSSWMGKTVDLRSPFGEHV